MYAKRTLTVFLCIAMLFNLSLGVFATSESKSTTASILSIIEDVNREYGTNFYVPAEKELRAFQTEVQPNIEALQADKLTVSELEQFEKELREAASVLSAESATAEAAWQAALLEGEKLENQINKSLRGSSLPKSGRKKVRGASISFEGWANNNNGYWAWEYLNTTSVTANSDDPKYRFYNDGGYDHTFIDSRRTCAVNYYGTMHTKVLTFWIPEDYTHYVEWSASM